MSTRRGLALALGLALVGCSTPTNTRTAAPTLGAVASPTAPPNPTTPARTAMPLPEPTPTRAASCEPFEAAAPDPAAIVELGPSPGIQPLAREMERYVIQGVLIEHTCRVRTNETFSAWQTDDRGYYGPQTPDGQFTGFWLQGNITTDDEGRFEIRTIRPGTNPAPDGELPAHIHIKLGPLESVGRDISIVFADDPAIDGPSGPLQYVVDIERRSDSQGEYWYTFFVLRL